MSFLALAMAIHGDGFEVRSVAEQVAMAHERSEPVRLAVAEFRVSNGTFPATLAALGLEDPYPAGPARATLRDGGVDLAFEGELAGAALGYAFWDQAGGYLWSCGLAPAPLDATLLSSTDAALRSSFTDDVLPDACRTAPSAATLADEVFRGIGLAKLAVSEYRISTGLEPATLADVGLTDPLPVGQAYVKLEDGALVATFTGTLAGETLAFAPWLQGNRWLWLCGHAPVPLDGVPQSTATAAANTSLDASVLPQECRPEGVPLAQQVLETVDATGGPRLAIIEWWISDQTIPASLAALGYADPLTIGNARLRFIDGILVATFVGALDGQSLGLELWSDGTTGEWVCGHRAAPAGLTKVSAGSASAATTLDAALLPEGCR